MNDFPVILSAFERARAQDVAWATRFFTWAYFELAITEAKIVLHPFNRRLRAARADQEDAIREQLDRWEPSNGYRCADDLAGH
jgi:hypothetical protein